MTSDPGQLLRLLGSGVKPAAILDGATRAAGSLASGLANAGEAAFAELLAQAQAGELSSHKLVSVDPDAGVTLTDEQKARLSLAADQAEAQGLRTALVVFDDQQVVLDVGTRTVTSIADLTPTGTAQSGLLAGVDGVINLSGKFAPAERTHVVGAPSGSPVTNPSLAEVLAKLEERGNERDAAERLKAG